MNKCAYHVKCLRIGHILDVEVLGYLDEILLDEELGRRLGAHASLDLVVDVAERIHATRLGVLLAILVLEYFAHL